MRSADTQSNGFVKAASRYQVRPPTQSPQALQQSDLVWAGRGCIAEMRYGNPADVKREPPRDRKGTESAATIYEGWRLTVVAGL